MSNYQNCVDKVVKMSLKYQKNINYKYSSEFVIQILFD